MLESVVKLVTCGIEFAEDSLLEILFKMRS
jgi:hypothetical protein